MAGKQSIALCLEYPLALRGGVSVVVETLLRGLQDHYDIVLVSPDTAETLDGVPIVKHIGWEPAAVSAETSRRLAQQLAEEEVALAHFHFGGNFGWGNRFISRCPIPYLDKLGVPVCSTIHSVPGILDGFCGPQKAWLVKLALLPFAWVGKMNGLAHLRYEIAASQHDMRKLRSWYWPIGGKFCQIYHSRLEGNPPEVGNASRERVILNVGHIAWRKGQLVLCEAFARMAARHPEWKLRLIGKQMEAPIEQKIRALAERPELRGRILVEEEQPNVREPMLRAAIYAQPSFHEALGLALQEAMFLGCACVGTRAGGIPELIDDDKTGLLITPGRVDEMAAALEKLVTQPALREKLGRAASASIVSKGMTAGGMIENHLELYRSIVNG